MQIRKVVCFIDEIITERGEPTLFPVKRAVAAAVIKNPWAGTPTSTSLFEGIAETAPDLALLLTEHLLEALGGAKEILGYGKGALVGLDGELEHAAALLHTPYFGNLLRERLAGTEYISFTDARAAAGQRLWVSMGHKTQGGRRDFFETVPLQIEGAPLPDELVVMAVATTGPRPNARIGDRTTDEKIQLSSYEQHPIMQKEDENI